MTNSIFIKVLHRVADTWAVRAIKRALLKTVNRVPTDNFFTRARVAVCRRKPKIESAESPTPPKPEPTKSARSLLLIIPFYGENGSSNYVDHICRDFKEIGYEIQTIVYNKEHSEKTSKLWDKTYQILPQLPGYLEAPRDSRHKIILENHGPDDWVGDELLEFIKELMKFARFDLCLVNYAYLSRTLLAVTGNTRKVLITHDVFTNRNSRILKSSNNRESFRFSLSAEDEAASLGRADLVVAITDSDKKYFQEQLGLPNVITIPYLPPPSQLAEQEVSLKDATLTIGFIGSAHRPNADAILEFVNCMRDTRGFELIIGGSVCDHLVDQDLPRNIFRLGYVQNLEDFYLRCDLIVNPDTLFSGLKTKCVEAVSYGFPIICTRAASQGLDPASKFHRAESVAECAQLVKDVIENPELLNRLRCKSRLMYSGFYDRYHRDNAEKIFGSLGGCPS